MMKRYKVQYWNGDRSKPVYLSELAKSTRKDRVRILFREYGKKRWQINFKNDLFNGSEKEWHWNKSKNIVFQNWKKGNMQGIQFLFK